MLVGGGVGGGLGGSGGVGGGEGGGVPDANKPLMAVVPWLKATGDMLVM